MLAQVHQELSSLDCNDIIEILSGNIFNGFDTNSAPPPMATTKNNLMDTHEMSTSVGIVYTAVAGIAWVGMGIASLFGYRPEPVPERESATTATAATNASIMVFQSGVSTEQYSH